MAHDNNGPTTTVFQPQNNLQARKFAQYFNRIPHYLIRTTSPRSAGTTTSTYVSSAAVKNSLRHNDIMALPPTLAETMVVKHLTWKNLSSDNLISWTNSLIFAVQHAIRRHETDSPDPKTGIATTLDNLQIWFLDTRKLPRETFLPVLALLQTFSIPNAGITRHEYFTGEYLSQGQMDIPEDAMVVTTLRALIGHGLYNLFPQFSVKNERTKLLRRVQKLRTELFDPISGPKRATNTEIHGAWRIASDCFDKPEFRPIIMIMLLSLNPRFNEDVAILETFRENGWGYFITNDNLDAYNTIPHYVPEYAQFIKIMHNIYDDTQDHLPTKNPQAYAENQRRNVLQQDEKRKAEEDAFDLSALAEALSLVRREREAQAPLFDNFEDDPGYDSYEEVCENNMDDIDDLMNEWGRR